jgi:hypothetical protein
MTDEFKQLYFEEAVKTYANEVSICFREGAEVVPTVEPPGAWVAAYVWVADPVAVEKEK